MASRRFSLVNFKNTIYKIQSGLNRTIFGKSSGLSIFLCVSKYYRGARAEAFLKKSGMSGLTQSGLTRCKCKLKPGTAPCDIVSRFGRNFPKKTFT